MNTAKTTGIALMLLVLFSYCSESDDPHPDRTPNTEHIVLNVYAEVDEAEIPIVTNDQYEIDLFGNISSCNLSNDACFSITGIVNEPDASGGFLIKEGELRLSSSAAGCDLWGQFTGEGTKDGTLFSITSDVNVTCGTGVFNSDGGKLKMTITGNLPSENSPYMSYELSLYGQIERKISLAN